MIELIINIASESILMFLEMAPYLILGLIFVAILNLTISKDMITKHVGKNDFVSILKASLFGIPLPLCSCGVVPTAVYMSKNGASKSATVSFLISTPQTGIDSMIATYGMMGPLFAFFRPFSSLITGLVGGLAVKYFGNNDKDNPVIPKFISLNQLSSDKIISKNQPKSLMQKIKDTFNYSFVEFLDDISVQFMVGVLIAGLISYLIPNDYFSDSGFNSGIAGMLLMIIIGAPMYVCATASIPIAMTLIMKGFTPGVAFVFLAVGPATNAATIAIISKSLGNKVSIIYLLSISVVSIIMGYILDFIYSIVGEGAIWHNHSSHNHDDMFLNDDLKVIIGIIFLVMILLSFYRKFFRKYVRKITKANDNNTKDDYTKINIEGMTCNHCVATVTDVGMNIKGVEVFDVHLDENAAYVKGKFNFETLKKEINNAGYKVVE